MRFLQGIKDAFRDAVCKWKFSEHRRQQDFSRRRQRDIQAELDRLIGYKNS